MHATGQFLLLPHHAQVCDVVTMISRQIAKIQLSLQSFDRNHLRKKKKTKDDYHIYMSIYNSYIRKKKYTRSINCINIFGCEFLAKCLFKRFFGDWCSGHS